MSFETEKQRGRVCSVLLGRVGLARLFTEDGPTPEALKRLKSGTGSSSEALMLKVAFDIWNERGGATVGRILWVFDRSNLESIVRLLLAIQDGDGEIVGWLADEAAVERRRGDS